jgi:hypothetical protein
MRTVNIPVTIYFMAVNMGVFFLKMKSDNVLVIKYLLLFVAREKKLPQHCTRFVDKVLLTLQLSYGIKRK